HRMHLGGAWYVNHADGQAKPTADQPWHSLFRAGRRVGDRAAEAHAASYRRADRPVANETEGLGRLLRGLTDQAWLAADGIGGEESRQPLPRDVWLESVEVLVAREAAGSSAGLTVAAKGGSNDENHNHNDVGSFLVASDGVPVIVDAGRPTYTLATFGPERYSIWAMQSSWHNVPEVRGVPQAVGRRYAAADVVAAVADDHSSLALNLSAAYPAPGLDSWHRTVQLDRGKSVVTITDAWSLEPWPPGEAGAEPATSVRLLLAGDVVLGDGTALITPLDGAPALRVRWPAIIPAILTMRPLDDPMLSDVWGQSLTRLDLDVTGRDSITVTVANDQPTKEDAR
ncbi:MAG: heparinase II/III family protein, partial [Cryobacterium sp.]